MVHDPAQSYSWTDANALARGDSTSRSDQLIQSHLATYKKPEHAVAATSIIVQTIASEFALCWIGLTDAPKEDQWQWITLEPYVFRNIWDEQQPSRNRRENFVQVG